MYKLLSVVPEASRQDVHCKVGCKGKKCKHEDWTRYEKRPNSHIAVRGLNSNFVGDDIVASQRPSSRLIREHNIIQQFKDLGINAVFNLQERGEHEFCGDGIQASSGFSYLPEDFMDHGIHFYNFPWPDMNVPAREEYALKIVQVMDSHVSSGGKCMVHCHAGLGRTGLIIACFLMYSLSWDIDHTVRFVRRRRKRALQTKPQVAFATRWYNWLRGLRRVIFPPREAGCYQEVMRRQRILLYGEEGRMFLQTPKLLYMVLNRLAAVCRQRTQATEALAQLANCERPADEASTSLGNSINQGEWSDLDYEESPTTLARLFWSWVRGLSDQLLSPQELRQLVAPAPPQQDEHTGGLNAPDASPSLADSGTHTEATGAQLQERLQGLQDRGAKALFLLASFISGVDSPTLTTPVADDLTKIIAGLTGQRPMESICTEGGKLLWVMATNQRQQRMNDDEASS